MRFSRFVFAGLIAISLTQFAAQAQPVDQVSSVVKTTELKYLTGSVHPLVAKAVDTGRVEGNLPLDHLILVLKRSDQQEAELRNLFAGPRHARITPEQFALRFGPSNGDLQQIITWLTLQGLHVDSVARGRQWIEFSGAVDRVEHAFHTDMHRYMFRNEMHVANNREISIPAALSPIVAGILSLNDFRKHSMVNHTAQVRRDLSTGNFKPLSAYTSDSGVHYLTPGDFARIYDSVPLLANGITGSAVSIAIPGRTNILPSDVQTFRQIFGLPANDPQVITNGIEPDIDPGDEIESDLDVQWAGAVAPDATIKFITSKSSLVTDGIDLSNAYIVDNRVAPIMSVSYGLCEPYLGNAGNAFYNSLFEQAAAEGITVFVTAGDNGSAGCDSVESYFPAQNGLAVNGLASTPYNVSVGGTQFNELDDGTYWASQNRSDLSSAKGYIPEMVWNESCDPNADLGFCSGTYDYFLFASSGGASSVYPKPIWQMGIGVPSDGLRDLPDLSLAAAGGHDGYLICVEGSCQTHVTDNVTILDSATVVGGTSAASPAMAGIMALVEQENGLYLGLANDDFYHLAARDNLSQCNSSNLIDPLLANTCIFHDTTAGENSVPGLTGYSASQGYDRATGLGSVDASHLVAAWSYFKMRDSITTLSSQVATVQHGQPFPFDVSVKSVAGAGVPSGDFALTSDLYGTFFGGTLIGGALEGSIQALPGGSYNLSAHYGGDSVFLGSDSIPIAITVLPEDSTTSLQGWEINFNDALVPIDPNFPPLYGQPVAMQVNASGLSGFGSATGVISIFLDGDLTPLAVLPLPTGGGGAYLEVDNLPAASGLLPGDHTLTATYSGDNSFGASASTYSLSVTQGSSRTTVQSSLVDGSIVVEGTPVELWVAAVGDGVLQPTGNVQLLDNGSPLGLALPLSLGGPLGNGVSQASATVFLTVGDHDLRAGYAGDSNYFSTLFFNKLGLALTVIPNQIFKDDFEGP